MTTLTKHTCFKNKECCFNVLFSISTFWLKWSKSTFEFESIVIDVEPIEAETLKLPAAAAATNCAPFSCLRSRLADFGSMILTVFNCLVGDRLSGEFWAFCVWIRFDFLFTVSCSCSENSSESSKLVSSPSASFG